METNVIVGNLFSLKGDHEKSALYFKRATIVDPQSINAWLLLGHELIELRNPSAAFAAYQHATICPGASRDMRPWYAMGQLFELINQMAFAVFYHNKAIQVNPKDPRVWKALSGCYLKLNRVDESNHCNLKVKGLSSDPSAMAM
jgi:anaphase-promoting complex subunit 8